MTELIRILVPMVLFVLVLLAVVYFLRRWLQAAMSVRQMEHGPVVQPEDPYPAAPVEDEPAAQLVAFAAIVWASLHVAAAIVWLGSGWPMGRDAQWFLPVAYGVVSACVLGIGGAMIVARKPFGRKLVAWGSFLLVTVGFLLMAASLILPSLESAPEVLRRIAWYLAVGFALHVVIDAAIGIAAQRVGAPPNWSFLTGQIEQSDTPGDQAPSSDWPGQQQS